MGRVKLAPDIIGFSWYNDLVFDSFFKSSVCVLCDMINRGFGLFCDASNSGDNDIFLVFTQPRNGDLNPVILNFQLPQPSIFQDMHHIFFDRIIGDFDGEKFTHLFFSLQNVGIICQMPPAFMALHLAAIENIAEIFMFSRHPEFWNIGVYDHVHSVFGVYRI